MKKIFLSVSFLLSLVVSFAQPKVIRSSGANTVMDTRLGAVKNFLPPQYTDTVQANLSANIGIDSCGAIIFTYDVMSLWARACSPKRWVRVGSSGSMSFENSSSVLFSGTGDALTPITAQVNVSSQQGNAIESTGQGLYVKNFIQDGIKVPGVITWISGYNYDVSPAVGVIGGIEYTSDWTPITLNNADPTYNRFDLVVFNAGGTITVIEGTPSDDPQFPVVTDPSTQLGMAYIEVTANTTEPPTPPSQDWIYINNNEWTTLSSTVRINPASTSNPYSATLDIQGTLAQNGDNIRFTSITPPTISNFNILTLKIRSASIWAADSRISLQWYSGASAVGSPVSIANGTYGFTSSQLVSYQIFSVPLPDFGALSSVTALLATVVTTGGRTISFYIDDIQLQQGVIPVTGNFWAQGGNNFGTTGILGTLDNNNINVIANNTLHTTIRTDGNTWMRATSPGLSFYLGSFSAGDYYMRRTGTGLTMNAGGIAQITIGAKSAYRVELNASRGHEWYDMASTPVKLMQLIPAGELYLGTSFADAGDYKFQLTGGARIDATGKTIALVGLSTDNTATQVAAKDASGNTVWRDVSSISGGGGGFVTADNGLTANTATNVQLGGTLLQNTSIATSTFTMAMSGTPAGSFTNLFTVTSGSTTGSAVSVISQGTNPTISAVNTKVTANGGWALYGQSVVAAPLYLSRESSGTNDVAALEGIDRRTSGTAADGIGSSLDFSTEMAGGTTGIVSMKLVSKLTNATEATAVSQFEVWGLNTPVSSAIARKFAIAGTGKITADGYGVGAITGTAAYTLQVDASGNIIEGAVGGGTTTIYTGNSSLTSDRTVSTAGFTTTWTGSNGSETSFSVVNSGASNAHAISGAATGTSSVGVTGTSSSYLGVYGLSTSSNGVQGESSSGAGVVGVSSTNVAFSGQTNQVSTNAVENVMTLLRRTSSGAGANGIGGAIAFSLETATSGTTQGAGSLSYKWTDATNGTQTSQFVISGVNSGTTGDILTLNGNKTIKANGYGTGGITGTAAFALAVDADGDIIEIALGGGGGGTVNSVAGTLNRVTSTGGTDPIIDISASYVGQASITTLGTIATGTWQGTAIGDTYISSATTWNAKQTGDATLTALAGLTITNGSIIYGTGADAFAVLAAGTNGQVLTLAGGVPTWSSVGSGTMTTISGVNTNGFTWSIANPTTTPALTLGTSITGILKGNGTAISAAVAGTDYLTPTGSAALLTSFPTFNQNTTGSAATLTTARTINGVSFNGSANITVTASAGTLTGATLNSSVVSSSLTGVATLTTGIWQATAIGLAYGGTGLTAGGTANQLFGMNAAGTGGQYKTISATNGATITHAANSVVVSTVFNPTVQTLTDGATITMNVTNGGNAKVTLAGTGRTLSITNPVAGYTYTVEITQGSGGSKTITTWPTGTTWSSGTAPTLSTTAGDIDVIVLYYNGTNYRGSYQLDYN